MTGTIDEDESSDEADMVKLNKFINKCSNKTDIPRKNTIIRILPDF